MGKTFLTTGQFSRCLAFSETPEYHTIFLAHNLVLQKKYMDSINEHKTQDDTLSPFHKILFITPQIILGAI